jgi:hypothetical protein
MRPPFVCALCPDMSIDTLVPLARVPPGVSLSAEQQARRKSGAAHKACVMYVPSTYIGTDEETGEDRVFGFEGIEKERWKLVRLRARKIGDRLNLGAEMPTLR